MKEFESLTAKLRDRNASPEEELADLDTAMESRAINLDEANGGHTHGHQ